MPCKSFLSRVFTSRALRAACLLLACASTAVAGNYVNQIKIGPIVQNTTTNSTQLIWSTLLDSSTVVDYGLTPALGKTLEISFPLTNLHVVTLGSLHPGSRYYYRVRSELEGETVISPLFNFKTFRMEGPVRFTAIGNTQDSFKSLGKMGMAMEAIDPDFIMHLGGLSRYGLTTTAAEATVFRPFGSLLSFVPVFPVPGYYEAPGNDEQAWQFSETFYLPTNSSTGTEWFYSFDHGDVHFTAVLNPSFRSLTPTNAQYRWLTNDLARTSKPWKLLYMHAPIATSGQYVGTGDPGQGPAYNMNNVLPIATQYGVQLVLSALDRNFQKGAPTNGLHHLVTGGGSDRLYAWLGYVAVPPNPAIVQFHVRSHFLSVSVEKDTLNVEALDVDGTPFEGFSIHSVTPADRVYTSTWNTPAVERQPPNNGDGNIMGQTFDLKGPPILPRAGQAANLGRFYVNNDATHLYLGFERLLLFTNQTLLVFLEPPRLTGVSAMRGLGNGSWDPLGEAVDGLDALENLSFTNFQPTHACVLGDEFSDISSRTALSGTGQGVFRLNPALSSVPDVSMHQFDRSPQTLALRLEGRHTESCADFVELAIPLAELGNPGPGEIIKLAAVAGGAYNTTAMTRSIDTALLGTSMSGAGFDAVTISGIRVRLAFPLELDTDGDGLSDNFELDHSLDPKVGTGRDGANGDPDGDGQVNLQEARAGTDPQDAASTLTLKATLLEGEYCRLDWSTVRGRKYVLEASDGDPRFFIPISSPPQEGTGQWETRVEDITPGFSRFYRVRVLLD